MEPLVVYNSNGNIPKTVTIVDTMDITTLMDIIMIVIGDNSRDIP